MIGRPVVTIAHIGGQPVQITDALGYLIAFVVLAVLFTLGYIAGRL